MALYEYECEKCCDKFEVRRSFSDESSVTCPKCQGEVKRIFSPSAIIMGGSGSFSPGAFASEPAGGSCGTPSRGFG